MTRIIRATLVAAAAVVSLAAAAFTPVQLVNTVLRVAVIGTDGRAVTGLTADDFVVSIEGRTVGVARARPESPLPVLLIIDVTTSSSANVRSSIERHVLGRLPHGTAVRAAAFGRALQSPGNWSTEAREQHEQLRRAMDVPMDQRTGPSPIWDALHDGLRTLLPPDGRAGVLLITDGEATGNRVRLDVPADLAIATGVPVSTVFVGNAGRVDQGAGSAAIVRPDLALRQLAAATGGGYFARPGRRQSDWTLGADGDPFAQAALSFSGGYELDVMVPARSGFQRVSVTTRDAAHVVRVRMGLRVQ
ncbi:MAG: hypothetical protein AB7L71_16285 [Vicinamibacterales bacterium]